ncbi:type IV pilus secretin PilQ [Burkholderia pseudomultivorans]|uniref:Type IV pilus biogenesis and competence protein PilQ n=1 Tax=Burkholderia pseudomultivorans TaxID=1207504 RepID=A0ABU2E7U2_9BURK|nr:type IV pilus secretin PilQ [Burkholderia pseudomultivorans]MDR8729928.1 Type IV pilus biogenesis and competence protein PilQ [Burkholderia pseudomultivorans]MDR8736240.1 Type IV pilus biogenesis and competence protein PilQ [Burkholderia pseudomultivorans]MDR8742500.1 Type IV pilus biogenesis and competence protein PilQ [Burkholderia pseudomultivorans]MDR8755583.1 Type IV pilus biogenesis and competence protein PilQ [Burkholderia pseudomultivorans]MDR8779179.1 Type IV pilus biogenesis and c
MTKYIWRTIAVWIGLGIGAASAALPPLPAVWPVAATQDAAAPDVPLPQRLPDGANLAAPTPEPADAGPPSFDHATRAALQAGTATQATTAPALEGPPIPLLPPARMSDATAHRPGDADDARRISLNLQQVGLAAAFDAFARFTGLNIVVSEQVSGTVTLRLNNVRWREAFDTLLDTHGLAMSRRGDVIWVTPAAELAARERERFEMHARAADLEPLASRTFVLRYPRAQDVQRLLAGATGQRLLSKRGAAAADPRTNLLFVTDLAPRVAQIAELIDAIDRPSRQVRIEARIVEGEQGFSRNLGVRVALRAQGRPAAADGTPFAAGARNALDLAARPTGGFDAATAGFTLFAAPLSRVLDIELSALEAQGRGQIVSRPRVVTADRAKAIVEQGAELPYQAKVGNGVSGVQFRRATLKLEVEPQITPDGRVVLDLDVTKDSVGEPTAAGPAIHTKHVQTRVEVEDGGTVAIGGIYERLRRDDVTQVPLLGKIPVLGALFRHRAQREQRSELVVFITPTVVRAGCDAAGAGDENPEETGPEAAGAGSTRQPLCQ